jgi:hypothetical protein
MKKHFRDTYTFSNSDAGRALRTDLHASLVSQGRTVREFSETLDVGGDIVTLLKLEVSGKRPGEGLIARDMKARKK